VVLACSTLVDFDCWPRSRFFLLRCVAIVARSTARDYVSSFGIFLDDHYLTTKIAHCMAKAVSRVEPLLLPWSYAPLYFAIVSLTWSSSQFVRSFSFSWPSFLELSSLSIWRLRGSPLFNKGSKRNCSILLGFLCYQLYLLFILFIYLSIVHPAYYGIGLLSCFVLWYCSIAQVPFFQ
jgi:hypothetical protein